MEKIIPSSKICIAKSKIPNAGRGVFATRNFKKGETIETCPIIELSKYDTSNLKESFLVTYFFFFGKNKERLAIALGFGSIYNHSNTPNATFKVKSKEAVIEFSSIKNIKKYEEITFDYHHGTSKKSPLWFE